MTDPDLRPPQQSSHHSASRWLWIALAIAAAGYGGWYAREYWAAHDRASQDRADTQLTAPQPHLPAPPKESPALAPLQPLETAPEPVVAPASSAASSISASPEVSVTPLPAMEAAALDQSVLQWLGPQALQFVVTPGVAHHIVATIDNLPRNHAAPRLWPLNPVGGKMVLQAQGTDASLQIAASNAARYDAVVDFVTRIDPAQAAQWYRQAAPLLQQTYVHLGYPDQQFHARLLAVIDHLLQTPAVEEPIAVRLVQVQDATGAAPQQPWLRYEFADSKLQSLSAGQKILLRIGAAHRQRILAYLQALRAQIAA